MKCQGELSIIGAYGGYSKTPAKHAPVVGNSVLNLLINILGSGSPWGDVQFAIEISVTLPACEDTGPPNSVM